MTVTFSRMKPAQKFETVFARDYPEVIEHVVREHQFTDERRWRFDYAWPSIKVAVEINGFGFGHQAQQQIAADNEKANAAVLLGWRLLRFDSRLLGSKQKVADAVEQTVELIVDFE